MKRQPLPPLSPAEQSLMDLIWKSQPVSVADLLEQVNSERDEPISRNTLQTQLTRLAAKGWLEPEEGGRVRLYRATVAETRGRGRILKELKERFFGNSTVSLVRCLVEEGGLDAEEVAELNALIQQHRKGGKK
ncbi:MAG: BlaI/MecI/CopY family transcriptional regulator [Luteolibacter sp.]